MTLITDPGPAFPPSAIAGLLLAARTWQAELGLPHPSVREILEATGATRSRAVRDDVLARLPDLVRQPGRPRASPGAAPADGDRSSTISREILQFVMEHPGCVRISSARRHYSDVLRHRVLKLRRENADLGLATFADAVAVPVDTVAGSSRSALRTVQLADAVRHRHRRRKGSETRVACLGHGLQARPSSGVDSTARNSSETGSTAFSSTMGSAPRPSRDQFAVY